MLRDNKQRDRSRSFQRDEGRSRYPESEWGENTEFGRNSEFRQNAWESDSYRKRGARPFDMDNDYSGRQFSVSGRDFSEEDEPYWMRSRGSDGREYNRSRFAEPYTGGQFARSQYGLGGDFGGRPSNYDAYADRGFSGKGPKGYRRSDDRIREEVCEALYRSPFVDASDIEVSVKNGCVTLKGTVDSRNAKREAESCIENLSGVDDIQNELRLRRAEAESNSGATGKSVQQTDDSSFRGH